MTGPIDKTKGISQTEGKIKGNKIGSQTEDKSNHQTDRKINPKLTDRIVDNKTVTMTGDIKGKTKG